MGTTKPCVCVPCQGVSGEYDAASATVLAARQALDEAAEGERAAFVAAGADAKLAKRISVENTEEGGVVMRVRMRLSCCSASHMLKPSQLCGVVFQ